MHRKQKETNGNFHCQAFKSLIRIATEKMLSEKTGWKSYSNMNYFGVNSSDLKILASRDVYLLLQYNETMH